MDMYTSGEFRGAVAPPPCNLKECKTRYIDTNMHSNILILALNDIFTHSSISYALILLPPFQKSIK